MSQFNVAGERYKPQFNEINLTTTQRPIHTDIRQVCSPEGYLRFGIESQRVDQCVANMMSSFEGYKSDEVVAAIGIVFWLVVDRFQLHMSDYLGFISKFIYGDDFKLGCIAMQRFLNMCFKEQLTRYEQVHFKNRTIKF